MFTLDTTIDAIQTAKKQAIKTFVQHEAIAKELNSFVDAQTEYTKSAVKAGTDVATKVGSELTKAAQENMKKLTSKDLDVFKGFDKVAQSYTEMVKSTVAAFTPAK